MSAPNYQGLLKITGGPYSGQEGYRQGDPHMVNGVLSIQIHTTEGWVVVVPVIHVAKATKPGG